IWSDPLGIVTTLQKMRSGQIPPWKVNKLYNRSLFRAITHVFKYMRTNVSISWVPGHQDHLSEEKYLLNQRADRAAKNETSSQSLPLIENQWLFTDDFFMLLEGNLFEGNIQQEVYQRMSQVRIYDFLQSKKGQRFNLEGYWKEASVAV